jgi:hypothetical protein
MKAVEPAMRNALGLRRVLGLTLLLVAVAAVAYLDRSLGGDYGTDRQADGADDDGCGRVQDGQ